MSKSKFKLKDLKPSNDFIEWNKLMSNNYDQDYYYEKSSPFIVWIEKLRLKSISNFIRKDIGKNNYACPTILEVGCGAGHVLKEIDKNIGSKKLIGLDPLENWLEISR